MNKKQKILMKTQNGSAHAFLILGLVFLTGAALSVVFLQNFAKQESSSSASATVAGNATTSDPKPPEVQYKTYTSPYGSGLTFDYPGTWEFDLPTKQTISRSDRKATMFRLTSQKLSDVNGDFKMTNDHMCVDFMEMQGSWPFGSNALNNADLVADFTVGGSEVSLMESKANLASGVHPAMLLLNQDPASKHGAAYIALKDEYYLLATGSKNCFFNDDLTKRDLTTEIEQTKSIIKSVRIAN